jgi:uncharacterized OsmC-like protein
MGNKKKDGKSSKAGKDKDETVSRPKTAATGKISGKAVAAKAAKRTAKRAAALSTGAPAAKIVAANGSASAPHPAVPATPTLRERQAALKLKYRVRPDSALITSAVHSVTEEGGDPRRVKIAVDGGNGTVFEIGAHTAVGGDDDLPCSGDVFLASLAACQELTIRLVAAALSLPIHRLIVRVEGDWDVRGTLAIERSSPVGFTDLRVNVELETEGADDRIERLLTSAERYCVVGQTLAHAPEVIFSANVTNRAHQQVAAD